MISPSQWPLPENTQHSQQTNIHAPCMIGTHDRSRRAAVDLRLRPRGYWDRLSSANVVLNSIQLYLILYCKVHTPPVKQKNRQSCIHRAILGRNSVSTLLLLAFGRNPTCHLPKHWSWLSIRVTYALSIHVVGLWPITIRKTLGLWVTLPINHRIFPTQ